MNIGSEERLDELQSDDSARTNSARTNHVNINETMITSGDSDAAESSLGFTIADAGAVEVSESFGRYKMIREIGRGAMGTVHLAHDTQLDRDVAIKIPKFAANSDEKEIERFYREARAMAMLRHANLCPVYDVGEIDGVHYLTMAYIEGQSLAEAVPPGEKLPPREAAELLRQIAAGVQQAHQAGIIHRDLKPANVMMDTGGQPVVMDFGLARRNQAEDGELTHRGVLVGSPAYMAPEQASNKNYGNK